MGEDLVRTIAGEDLARLDAVVSGDGFAQHGGLRVRIKLQPLLRRLCDRGDDTRRWRVGVFVGIELDQVGDAWLLAGNIRHQLAHPRAPERWASRHSGRYPSRRASVSNASSTIHNTTERHTSPTMLRRCPISASRPGVLSVSATVCGPLTA